MAQWVAVPAIGDRVRLGRIRWRLGGLAGRLPSPVSGIADDRAEMWWDELWILEEQLLALSNSSGPFRGTVDLVLDRVAFLQGSLNAFDVPDIGELLSEIETCLRKLSSG